MIVANDTGNEQLLWSQFRNGDAESFVLIFRSYYEKLFHYGTRITQDSTLVEDCIQDLFTDLWRNQGKAEIKSLPSYIFSAFKFKLIRSIAARNKITPSQSEFNETNFEISREMFLISEQNDLEIKQKVFNAIQELSARQKEIIYLKFNQNLSYDEVSEIMGINYQAARNLLSQAIKVLKKIMMLLMPAV